MNSSNIPTHHRKNSWICEDEKTLLTFPIMDLVERKCRSSESDKKYNFYLMKTKDWCNIIPITEDGNIVVVKQYRIGISEHTLEVPGGVLDASDLDGQAAAIRELEEETGYSPLPGAKCVKLGWTFPNPAIMDNRCHSYIIGPVRKNRNQNLDPGEMIEVEEIPISKIPHLILKGQISHALMLNTFFFLALRSETVSNILMNELDQFSRMNNSK